MIENCAGWKIPVLHVNHGEPQSMHKRKRLYHNRRSYRLQICALRTRCTACSNEWRQWTAAACCRELEVTIASCTPQSDISYCLCQPVKGSHSSLARVELKIVYLRLIDIPDVLYRIKSIQFTQVLLRQSLPFSKKNSVDRILCSYPDRKNVQLVVDVSIWLLLLVLG
jgi:hypothetical protein